MMELSAKSAFEAFTSHGFALIPGALSEDVVRRLTAHSEGLLQDRAGTRSVLDMPWGLDFVGSDPVREALDMIGFPKALCVRGILFDKHARANWKVPWHQDRKIAVRERLDVPSFLAWSVKEGVVHCQPPAEVLNSMFTLRFHLDPCGTTNGPLKVVSGSHLQGLLPSYALDSVVDRGPVETLVCHAGDLIAMRPLILHSSSEASQVRHRRVLHLEFATTGLLGGLEWRWQV